MNSDDDESTVEIPALREQVLAEEQSVANDDNPPLDDLNTLSAAERAWLEWFYALSAEDKEIVQICADKGIVVNATNIEQMKGIVKSYEDTDSGASD